MAMDNRTILSSSEWAGASDDLGHTNIDYKSIKVIADDKSAVIQDGIIDITGEYRINGVPFSGGGDGIPAHSESGINELDGSNRGAVFTLGATTSGARQSNLTFDRNGAILSATPTGNPNFSTLTFDNGGLNFIAQDTSNNRSNLITTKRGVDIEIGTSSSESVARFREGSLTIESETAIGGDEAICTITPYSVYCNDMAVPAGVIPLELKWSTYNGFWLDLARTLYPSPLERIVKISIAVQKEFMFSSYITTTWMPGEFLHIDGAEQISASDFAFSCHLWLTIPANTKINAGAHGIGVMFSESIDHDAAAIFPTKVFGEVYLDSKETP